ncbi:MAG: hypothetical protein GKR95_14250 [Gammaproteobacteria bacterium]|nr:hypothetical protein [Gammaproteobacteria bacterium]
MKEKAFPLFDVDPNQPTGFPEIIAMIRNKAQTQSVFFKDMGYYVVSPIQQHPELSWEWQHLFIIRDPRKSILSYYKLDPHIVSDEIGFEAQWKLFQWIKETRPDDKGVAPVVLQAEAVQNNPIAIMNAAWKKIGLAPNNHAFSWSDSSTPADWQVVAGWHETAQTSTGIAKPLFQTEAELETQFNSVADRHPKLHQYREHHWPYYEKLKAVAKQQFENASSDPSAP